MLNSVEARLADPRFKAFQLQRQGELLAMGLPLHRAYICAAQEIRLRAEASLSRGVAAALDATFIILDGEEMSAPRCFLIGDSIQ